jgi:hypothetical protein
MRGIDWDKVRRNRNVWKPDYREDFLLDENRPDLRDSAVVITTLKPTKKVFTQSLRASEIKARLRKRGLRGSKLKENVHAVLKGEQQLAWIEFDLDCEEMRGSGFDACPAEKRGSEMLLRFRRRSAAGEVVEERVYTLIKAAS